MTKDDIAKSWDDLSLEKREALSKVAESYLWWSGLFTRLGFANKFLVLIAGLLTAWYAFKDAALTALRGSFGG